MMQNCRVSMQVTVKTNHIQSNPPETRAEKKLEFGGIMVVIAIQIMSCDTTSTDCHIISHQSMKTSLLRLFSPAYMNECAPECKLMGKGWD